MSKSANIVAKSLLNTHHVSVKLGMMRFRVYQPFVKDLARAFAKGEINISMSGKQEYSIETISRLLFKRSWSQKLFLWYARRYATYEEISAATMKIVDIVSGKDLFDSVKIDKTRREKVSETVGNNTITGIIATMMEQLNISYKEAFRGINYPTMLLMMADKVRTLVGDEQKIIRGSGAEMARRRGNKKRGDKEQQ
ncbi:hypothetical protein [Alistipes sp.]|uniref:hypothetical protein n=1 Tax=Alistipes sp. TaxID=1872444 RepID=UPI003AB7B60B